MTSYRNPEMTAHEINETNNLISELTKYLDSYQNSSKIIHLTSELTILLMRKRNLLHD